MGSPEVSVVCAVRNGERYLEESLQSALVGQDVDLELIVVDDGSTDRSAEIVEGLRTEERRIRLVRQEHGGLTQALVRGCEEARGEFIARHDADDLSLPGRFSRQTALLSENPGLAVVSCWSLVIGPRGEVLQENRRPAGMAAPTPLESHDLHGPLGHGSAMFRAETYRSVGGYRPDFYYAQDVDLWYRLGDAGMIAFVPDFLYAYRFQPGSISMTMNPRQRGLAEIALECRELRRSGRLEQPALEKARAIRPSQRLGPAPGENDGAYFIGRRLLDRRDRRALGYLLQAVLRGPVRVRACVALGWAALVCRGEAREIRGVGTSTGGSETLQGDA